MPRAPRGRGDARLRSLLLLSALVIAVCGLVYELSAGALASYVLGDSVTQFSTIIGTYLSAMGLGSWCSRYVKGDPLAAFIRVELLVGLLGGFSAPLLFWLFGRAASFRLPLYASVTLTGTLVGLEIPLILRLLRKDLGFEDLVSKVLTLDYIGALAASLLFPLLLVPHLGLLRGTLLFGLINAALGLAVLESAGPRLARPWGLRLFAVAVLLALGMGFALAQRIEHDAEGAHYPDPIVLSKSTSYQRLVLTQGRGELRLYLNGNLQFSSKDEYRYHEALVHPGFSGLKSPKRALVLGGGDGLALRELLRYPQLEQVTLVDLDPAMTQLFSRAGALSQLNGQALQDPRVTVVHADAFAWLGQAATEPFDFVVADFPDPSNFSIGKLYSTAFYARLKRVLRPDGALVVQASSPYYARGAYWCVAQTLRASGFQVAPYHCLVPSFGEWGYVLAHQGAWSLPQRLPAGLRYLDASGLAGLFEFPRDMAPVPAPVNRLNDQALVRLFEREWAQALN